MRDVLKKIVALWLKQAELCQKAKKRHFDETAQQLWDYVGKSYRQIFVHSRRGKEDEAFPYPQGTFYCPRINKSREFVAVMMPYVLAQVPHRLVAPRRPQMPAELVEFTGSLPQSPRETAGAWLLQWLLNYLPIEHNLIHEQRMAVPEALVKGRGLVWHGLGETPTGILPQTYYDTVDGLLIDADAEQLRDAGFIIRIRRRSAWRVAQEFSAFTGVTIDVDKLRSGHRSNLREAQNAARSGDAKTPGELEGDIIEYYEVFSRMGTGRLLVGAPDSTKERLAQMDATQPHVWLAVMKGLDYPLNLPPELIESATDAEIQEKLRWPVPLYADNTDPWPCTSLDFYPCTSSPWATSALEGALPLQVFLDHIYAYLMDRIRTTCRNIYVVWKGLDPDIVEALEKGFDQEIVVTADDPQQVKDAIHVVIHPEVNADAWRIISMVEATFERMTGMLPLLSGAEPARQLRSAREADIREAHVTSRPDDMADCVEDWNSRIARKEAQLARMNGPAYRVFGEPGPQETPEGLIYPGPLSNLWEDILRTYEPEEAAGEYLYSIEYGTGRRKNKQKQMADAQALVQLYAQPFLELAAAGIPTMHNSLMDILGEAYDMPLDRLKMDQATLEAIMQRPEEEAERVGKQATKETS